MTISPVTPQAQAAAFITQTTTLKRAMERSPDTDRARERCEGITTAFTKTMAALGDASEHTALRGTVTEAYAAVMAQAENSIPSTLRGLREIIHGIYERAINPPQPAAPAPAAPVQAPAPAPTPAPVLPLLPATPAPAQRPVVEATPQPSPAVPPLPRPAVAAQPAAIPEEEAPVRAPIPQVVERLLPAQPFAFDALDDATVARNLQAALQRQMVPAAADLEAALLASLEQAAQPARAAPERRATPVADDADLEAAIRASLARPAASLATVLREPTPPVDDDEEMLLARAISLSVEPHSAAAVRHPRVLVLTQDVGFGNRLAIFGQGTIWEVPTQPQQLSWNQGIDLVCQEANVWGLHFEHEGNLEFKIVLIAEDGSRRWEVGTENRTLTEADAEYLILEPLEFGEPQRS